MTRKTPRFDLISRRFVRLLLVLTVGATVVGSPSVSTAAPGDPELFTSRGVIRYVGAVGSEYAYELSLSSETRPYHDLYLVLDPVKVVPGKQEAVHPAVRFTAVTVLGQPGVRMHFSADGRSVANIQSSRLLDANLMDGYHRADVSGLPEGTRSITVRMRFNRKLSYRDQVNFGYWVGDLRGLLEPGVQAFTESDGTPAVAVGLDIKPGSCPNAFNTKRQGVTTVAVLGAEDFDVRDILPESITLGGASPQHWSIEDTGGPSGVDDCSCPSTDRHDGYDDLVLKFDFPDLLEPLLPVADGDVRTLDLEGLMADSSGIAGSDCVTLQVNGNGMGRESDGGQDVAQEVARIPVRLWMSRTSGTRTQGIHLDLPQPSTVVAEVYSLQGSLLASWGPLALPQGEHQISWDTSGLPSGVYFVRAQADRERVSTKAVLLAR